MNIYFLGSYANGAINMPKQDALYEALAGYLPSGSTYKGVQMDKETRLYGARGKIRQDLRGADILLLAPSRMNTSYFEIQEALTLKKEIWILCEPSQFLERGNYPYSLPNFKYISLEKLKPLLEHSDFEKFLGGLAEGEVKR